MTGVPGFVICASARPASTSAFCCTSVPARVIGAIAPDSAKAATHRGCRARAISTMPSPMGPSRRRGELVLMLVKRAGRSASSSRLIPITIPIMARASVSRSRLSA